MPQTSTARGSLTSSHAESSFRDATSFQTNRLWMMLPSRIGLSNRNVAQDFHVLCIVAQNELADDELEDSDYVGTIETDASDWARRGKGVVDLVKFCSNQRTSGIEVKLLHGLKGLSIMDKTVISKVFFRQDQNVRGRRLWSFDNLYCYDTMSTLHGPIMTAVSSN